MENSNSNNAQQNNTNWTRFGLGTETAQRVNANTSGFVDLSNDFEYGAGGHQAAGANELFAEEQVYKFNLSLMLSDKKHLSTCFYQCLF